MNCRRAKNMVFELIDGLADESVRAELENHLAGCADCEKLATEVTRSMDLLHRAPVETLDENFNWKVRLAIHRERHAMREGASSHDFRVWNLRYAASAVVGCVFMVAVGWMAFGSGMVKLGNDTPAFSNVGQPAQTSAQRQPGGDVFTDRSAANVVSQGVGGAGRTTPAREGAIGGSNTPANLDSLVRAETVDMNDAERIEYLEAQIRLFSQHLDQCKEQQRK